MKRLIQPKQLRIGKTVRAYAGFPSRIWCSTIANGKMLTPCDYVPVCLMDAKAGEVRESLIPLRVAHVKLPFAILVHDDDCGPVRVWVDTREVELFYP